LDAEIDRLREAAENMPYRRTYFVSDLHLFSRRSLAVRHEAELHSAAAQARVFVLGGDIFDFRWSTYDSPEATARAAIRWLDNLVASHPRCDFHFVLGNHDCNGRFVSALGGYLKSRSNLLAHPYYLRMGSSIFLHGDAADRPRMCAQQLQRRRQHWARDEKRGQIRHMLYDLAMQAQLHRVVGKVAHPKRRVASRLAGYLSRIGHSPATGLSDVYFGHTHEAMADYRSSGLTFHNGGAPMPGLEFRIVEVAA
jgi:UDP-2,3-diacylglucosamine pyrophosphatase LpxH